MVRVFMAAIALMLSSASHAGSLRDDLNTLAHERVYFGHQSVGKNILDGLKELSEAQGVPVKIAERPGPQACTVPGSATSSSRRTGIRCASSPISSSRSARGSQADLALVKFCYVDINADTDMRALFDAYRKTIDELRAKTHARSSSTSAAFDDGADRAEGVDEAASRPCTLRHHRQREARPIQHARRTYAGREPIFDLARVESIAADGTRPGAVGMGRWRRPWCRPTPTMAAT